MKTSKIFLLGGSGKLGQQLIKTLKDRNIDYFAPTHKECDIIYMNQIRKHIERNKPEIIIHSAGFVDTPKAEVHKKLCVDTNVLGTYNIVELCREYGIRLIFISSEYVFSGEEDVYKPNSPINGKSIYGLTKGCGELMTRTLDDYIIIRAPFIRAEVFPHPKAFVNQYTSRKYIHEITDEIIDFTMSDKVGIKHIVGEYQSVMELAKQTKSDVDGMDLPKEMEKYIPLKLNLIGDE